MRVVIGEDETLLRQGLQLLLEGAGMEVVAAVGAADLLLEAVARGRPDLVVTDIRMPPDRTDDGLRAALRIRADWPGTAVMVLSQFVQRRYALELLGGGSAGRAGVGYLLKERIADVDEFCDALRHVAAGGTVLDPEVVEIMMATTSTAALGGLTPRQREVLSLIAEGRSNAAIAARLQVSEKAVVQHSSRIYDQFGLPNEGHVHRRVLAVIRYLAEAAP